MKTTKNNKKKGLPKGVSGNPNGRPKGTPNKSTMMAREAIAMFVEGNVDRLSGWLDEIAEKEGAKAAFNCFMDVVEYHVPKLQRTELTGMNGGAIAYRPCNESDKAILDAYKNAPDK